MTVLSARLDASVRSIRQRLRGANYLRKWVVLGALIGVVGGLGAIAFFTALELATQFFLEFLGGYTPPSPAGEGGAPIMGFARAWALPLVVALGGLISGVVVWRFGPEAEVGLEVADDDVCSADIDLEADERGAHEARPDDQPEATAGRTL